MAVLNVVQSWSESMLRQPDRSDDASRRAAASRRLCSCIRNLCLLTASRSLLAQAKIRSVIVVIAAVLIHQTFQMTLIETDRMVGQIAEAITQRSATPFCRGLRKLV